MVIYGKFNDSLEMVKFTLRYEYQPKKEILSLKSLVATLGIASKTYRLRKSADIPPATKVYDFLSKEATLNLEYDLYNTLKNGFHKDRLAENDYHPYDREKGPRIGRPDQHLFLDKLESHPYKRQWHKMRLKK
jgi:hypothetical protein